MRKSFKQQSSIEEKRASLTSLIQNPKWKDIEDAIALQDALEPLGENIDLMLHMLRYDSKIDYKSSNAQKIRNHLAALCLPFDSFNVAKVATKFGRELLDHLAFDRYCFNYGGGNDFTPSKSKLITMEGLHALLFKKGNFYAYLEDKPTLLNRGLYWVKAGRLLFSFEFNKRGGIEAIVAYLDPKKKSKTHFLNIYNKGLSIYDNFGDLIKRALPFDFTHIGNTTLAPPPLTRVMKNIFDIAKIVEVSDALRKILFKIATQTEFHPSKDLAILHRLSLNYTNSFSVMLQIKTQHEKSNSKVTPENQAPTDSKVFIELFNENFGINKDDIKKLFIKFFINKFKEQVGTFSGWFLSYNVKKLIQECYSDNISLFILFNITFCEMIDIGERAWNDYRKKYSNAFSSVFDLDQKLKSSDFVPYQVILGPSHRQKIYQKITQKYNNKTAELIANSSVGSETVLSALNTALKFLKDKGILSQEAEPIILQGQENLVVTTSNGEIISLKMTYSDLHQLHQFLDYECFLCAGGPEFDELDCSSVSSSSSSSATTTQVEEKEAPTKNKSEGLPPKINSGTKPFVFPGISQTNFYSSSCSSASNSSSSSLTSSSSISSSTPSIPSP